MPAAYSKDLRERVVAAYEVGDVDHVEVTKRFDRGEATVRRGWALKRKTGSVAPKPSEATRPYRRPPDSSHEHRRPTWGAAWT